MARPPYCRKIGCEPDATYFKPKGIPASMLEEVALTLDEFEAVRLADLEGLYQEEAAARMRISRQTFGRIIESARGKIADALVNGKALKIEGGNVSVEKTWRCPACRKMIDTADGQRDDSVCPNCGSKALNKNK